MQWVLVIVHLLIVAWVWADAARNTPARGLWVLIALVAPLLGLLVYLAVRPLYQDVDRYGARLYELERRTGGPPR